MQDYTLNEQQLATIKTIDGPVLVSAGAGTGKTLVLSKRVSYILSNALSTPDKLLVVTFTNRAANELKSRLQVPLQWVGTFHSICARMLRTHGKHIGLNNNFKILNQEEQKRLVRKLDIPQYIHINEAIEQIEQYQITRTPIERKEINVLYQQYESIKNEKYLLDYNDLLIRANELLDREDLCAYYQTLFDFIFVDEYQDTNAWQNQLLRRLLNDKQNLFCVGDEDQSIFEWRGSDTYLMRDFSTQFSNARILKLELNYRSTSNILCAANQLIKHNKRAVYKVLRAFRSTGTNVTVTETRDEYDEAQYIAAEIRAATGSTAVLCRTSGQLRVLEEAFKQACIACKIVGSQSFYERSEVREVYSYAKYLIDANNFEAFSVIANIPKRGLGPKALSAIRRAENFEYAAKNTPELVDFFSALDECRNLYTTTCNPGQALERMLRLSQYLQVRAQDNSREGPQRLENVEFLIAEAYKAKSLRDFCAHIEQQALKTNNTHQVHLMTIHTSKGLEFDNVFIAGCEEGLLPHASALITGNIEEERRLMYVAVTRAKNSLVLSYAKTRYRHAQLKSCTSIPSRFLMELPPSVHWTGK